MTTMTASSHTLTGLGVSSGCASGPIHFVQRAPGVDPNEPRCSDVEADTQRVREAMNEVSDYLLARSERASDASRDVMVATSQLARDKGLLKSVTKELTKGAGVTAAVEAAVTSYAAMLESLGGYMAERVTDLYDVRDRLICQLRGLPAPGVGELEGQCIIVAHDLSPAETAVLDLDKVLGVVTELGGPTSHTAILCAQLGIPAVVRCAEIVDVDPQATLALDGSRGSVIVNPSADEVTELTRRAQVRAELLADSHGPGQTADGHPVKLLANIGSAADAVGAAGHDVEGCGLFRTEFLFLDRADAPSYDEQVETYTKVLEAFGDRRVVVRTLDAGADKPLKFADLGAEENPALGVRGLRLNQVRTDLLETQLKALAEASRRTEADLWVMAPMVATVAEAQWFRDKACEAGLKTIGVMIEIPAAALMSGEMLASLSFASIGTNDLAQYTMAADRMQGSLAELNSVWQPAVLRMIQHAVDGATRADAHIGVCGEAGGDPLLALVLVGLGVKSLSMAPSRVAAVRESLARLSYAECQELAQIATNAPSADQARHAVTERVPSEVLALI